MASGSISRRFLGLYGMVGAPKKSVIVMAAGESIISMSTMVKGEDGSPCDGEAI